MNKKFSLLSIIGILLFYSAIVRAEILPSTKVSMDEFPDLTYVMNGPIFKLPINWKFAASDNPEYAGVNYDDSKWENVEVGKPKAASDWCWYRVSFDLPANLENKNLLLDLGRVSVYDEIYVNGVQVGHFGNPPPNFVNGASDVWRKYPIAAEHFHPGKNVLAVRVFPGYKGGLYEGAYTLQALSGDMVRGRLNLKTDGADALETLLTEAVHLNVFAPGSKLLVAPDVSQLFGSPMQGNLSVKLVNSKNQLVAEDGTPLTVNAMEWSRTRFRFAAPFTPGNYSCHLSFSASGKVLWEQNVSLRVQPFVPLNFSPPVDSSLASLENESLPISVSPAAMGHFGPREVNEKWELFDDLTKTDSRSGLAYSVQILKSLGAPRIFLANTKRVPVDPGKIGRLHRAAGYNYDGLRDPWVYGFVRPNRAGALADLITKSTSWAKRTYRYTYKNNDWMDFSISAISPAWIATSNAQKMRVFEDVEKNGVGLPTYLAYESQGKIKIVDAKKGIHGSDMSANWVLAWFNGGAGWDEFDTPYLFVLQKRPQLVQCYADTALFFSYTDSAGTIQGMPLYGETLQRLSDTANWKNALPTDVVDRCRYWSHVLVNAPDEVTRTAKVDYEKDQLTVKDEFSYLNITDDWKTPGIKIAPVSPILSLAAHAGNINIAVSKPVQDLHMATLQGPFAAANNADKILFRVNGMLHYTREVRDVKIANDPQTHQAQAELNQIVKGGLESELKNHPWESTVFRGEFTPGRQRLNYTNLILALPYLEPSLRAAVEKEIQTETEKYFLDDGIPDAALASKLKPEFRDRPLVSVITNPISHQQIAVGALAEKKFGIDQTYFTALNIYMMWFYGDTFHRYDWLQQKYPLLQKYFNVTRNSHDWDTGVSWDTFSGLRVGNGLQESGGIFAGMVGMARIAHKLGDKSTSDAAAYYAVMESVGMQGQLAASEYLKQRRPWLNSNTKAADIEYVQKIRPYYFAEFNEFAGLSQAIIGSHNSASSPGGFIESPLPETMRLYQEVWPKFTNEFYDPKYDKIIQTDRRIDSRISLDAFVYQITQYPQTVQQVFDVRKKLDLDWWGKLPDYRAYLDSRGQIGYRKLW